MSTGTGRESDKFMLRLPDGMRDRIKAAADANNRSMNAEIVATLEHEYPAPILPPLTDEDMIAFFDQMLARLNPEDEAYDPVAFKKYVDETKQLRDMYKARLEDALNK